jgi:hypothetical protein
MQLESEMRVDPEMRADAFVQRRSLLAVRESTRAGRVADRMIGMAKPLERDPQPESIRRQRKQAFGLPSYQSYQSAISAKAWPK